MDYKKLNSWLKDLENLPSSELKYVETIQGHQGVSGYETSDSYYSSGEGVQGESDINFKVYKVLSEDNLFLKVETYTDSYGSGEYIRGVEFVEGTKKEVTSFEPVK